MIMKKVKGVSTPEMKSFSIREGKLIRGSLSAAIPLRKKPLDKRPSMSMSESQLSMDLWIDSVIGSGWVSALGLQEAVERAGFSPQEVVMAEKLLDKIHSTRILNEEAPFSMRSLFCACLLAGRSRDVEGTDSEWKFSQAELGPVKPEVMVCLKFLANLFAQDPLFFSV